jgi:hypothetical protein
MRGMESKAKLTLWVDKDAVRFGKELAKKRRESLSGLVTSYLTRLRDAGTKEPLTPMVQKLSGVLRSRQGPESYHKHLEKKHLAP